VKFWDSSGLVPLLLDQPETPRVRHLLEEDPELVVWWGTPLECVSAVARVRREGALDLDAEAAVHALLDTLQDAWTEILPSEALRRRAARILRVHSLRAADALQLAAALIWSERTEGTELVTFGERLTVAARLEGLRVLPS
jgi:hypothetical protein